MKRFTTLLAACCTVALVATGCSTETTPDRDKPAADMDVAVQADGKADAISNWWTTRMGQLDGAKKGTIDWPDWYHGYYVEMEAGQTFSFLVRATAKGKVRLYGPDKAHFSDGHPKYRRAVVKTHALGGDEKRAEFEYTAEETATYMIVYGPSWVWRADYAIETTCVDGCLPDDACLGDDECGAGEYCGDNGVRCVTHPCTANYDICKPREDAGAWCDRDRVCNDGLVCGESATCEEPVVSDCADADLHVPCDGGFCGCAGEGAGMCDVKACKPWSAEGEGCGGYVPVNMVRICDPSLSCIAPQFIADIPGNCGVAATVEDLLADPKAYDGRFVALTGHINPGLAYCTKMACSVDNPCCNSCGSSLRLYDDKAAVADPQNSLRLEGDANTTYSCSGNECNFNENCNPQVGKYWVAGWFRYDSGEGVLEVTRKFSSPW